MLYLVYLYNIVPSFLLVEALFVFLGSNLILIPVTRFLVYSFTFCFFEKERRVLLNDMSVAEVKKTSLRFPISPEVDLVADSKGQRPAERKTIELIKNKDLWIKRFLQK